MMDKYGEKFLSFLTNVEGFSLEEIKRDSIGDSLWIAIRDFPEGNYAVIITDMDNEDRDCIDGMNYLIKLGKSYNFHEIILTEHDNCNPKKDNINKAIINKRKNKILYTDKENENLAHIAIQSNGKQKPTRGLAPLSTSLVTFTIIAINIIMYIISGILSGNLFTIDSYVLLELGAKYSPLIDQGEVWRLVTCTFLHGNFFHILFNMYSLYVIGTQIEVAYGKVKYLIIYFISGIGASYLSYQLAYDTLSIGASGAIFGLLGALLIFVIEKRNGVKNGAIANLILVIGINLYIGLTSTGIDNYAHVGGLVCGMVLAMISNIITGIIAKPFNGKGKNKKRNKLTS